MYVDYVADTKKLKLIHGQNIDPLSSKMQVFAPPDFSKCVNQAQQFLIYDMINQFEVDVADISFIDPIPLISESIILTFLLPYRC